MKKVHVIIILTFLFPCLQSMGQAKKTDRIYEYAIDSVNHKIFYVITHETTTTLKRNLVVIDALSGANLLTGPAIDLPGNVTGITTTNGKLFIGCTGSPRGGPAALFQLNPNTGDIMYNWDCELRLPDLGDSITTLESDQSRLYVGGYFQDENGQGTVVIDIATAKVVTTPAAFNSNFSKKIILQGNDLFLLSKEGVKIFSKTDFSLKRFMSITGFGGAPTDFSIGRYNALFIGGRFNNYAGALKFDYSTGLRDTTLSFKYFGTQCAGSATPYFVSDFLCYDQQVFVAGNLFSPTPCREHAGISTIRLATNEVVDLDGDTLPQFKTYSLQNRKLKTYGCRLFTLSTSKTTIGGVSYERDTLGGFCIRPKQPEELVQYKSIVCKGEQGVVYEIKPQGPNVKYIWKYNKPGVTIVGSGNKIAVNFSDNATFGALTVYVISECGKLSGQIGTEVSFWPAADANAGADAKLNCTTTSVQLSGSSTSTPVTYSWLYPNGSVVNGQVINATAPGAYQLTVTNSSTGCTKKDDVQVTMDTIHSVVTSPLVYGIYTCKPDYITATATSNNPGDEIKWFGPGIPTTNPAILHENTYTLEVKRTDNGCKTTVPVKVVKSVSYPKVYFPPNVDISVPIPITDTLTCLHDSSFLFFQRKDASVIIFIKRPAPFNDTVGNNSYTTVPGLYEAFGIDSVSKCQGPSIFFEIKINTTPPQVSILTKNPNVNCSASKILLNGSSKSPHSGLYWKGPAGFSSPNPATISQPGMYVLTVTDSTNGCKKSDSVTVVKQNKLLLTASADTTICKGSEAQLSVSPIGGTPAFMYKWNGSSVNSSTIKVSPVVTTQYVATVTDAAGCVGQDTIWVKIPKAIKDSTLTFQPCDPKDSSGQIQIFASGGIPPYLYSANNGATYQPTAIFKNLAFGNYLLIIKDSLSCKHAYTATISSLSLKPTADFLVSTTLMQADTFVVVDISNPRPDTLIWKWPASVTVINNDPYAPVLISSDTGKVVIDMEAHFGSCVTHLLKEVKFIKSVITPVSPNGNGIQELTLYPNPNSGQFSVEVKLYKKQTVAMYIYNAQGIEQARKVISETDNVISAFDITGPPGAYVLKVVAQYDSKARTFTIIP